jgi:DNA (cytosine-5)-methyltransferase 1
MTAIDLFAGLGGWTEGARQAGVRVLWAANHWRSAVDIHAANHPGTSHACQDLHQADWTQVPRHDVLLASPACQGHSKARGKERPHHDATRSTAWAVVSAAECHRPPLVVVENVPDFAKWSLFPAWRQAMGALGYSLSENLIDAADCGVPQNRVRLLIVGTRSRSPLALRKPEQPHVAADHIIDFKAGRWSPVHRPGRAAATLERYAAGRRQHGERFVMPFYGSGSGKTGRSLHRPIGTITTLPRWAIVDDDRMRMLSVDEAREAMSFPADYRLPACGRLAMHMLGNAVPPLMAREVLTQIVRAA